MSKRNEIQLDVADLNDARDELEVFVDRLGIKTVLVLLAEIAQEKAVHVISNWADRNAAKQWDTVEKNCNHTAAKIDNI